MLVLTRKKDQVFILQKNNIVIIIKVLNIVRDKIIINIASTSTEIEVDNKILQNNNTYEMVILQKIIIKIDGTITDIMVSEINGPQAKVGINAPQEIIINRKELYDKKILTPKKGDVA